MLGDLTMSCCDPMYFAQSQWTWLVKETLEPVAKNVQLSRNFYHI